jgi:ankyrin repeat protein
VFDLNKKWIVLDDYYDDIEISSRYFDYNDNTFTGFQMACLAGELEASQFLVSQNCEYDHCDPATLLSPLHLAAMSLTSNVQLIEFLITLGLDVNALDFRNTNAFYIAAATGKLDVLKCLEKHGSNIYLRDGDGDSAFHETAYYFHGEIAKYLLCLDEKFYLKDFYGEGSTSGLQAAENLISTEDFYWSILQIEHNGDTNRVEFTNYLQFSIHDRLSTLEDKCLNHVFLSISKHLTFQLLQRYKMHLYF